MSQQVKLMKNILEKFGVRLTLISGMVLIATLACVFVIAYNHLNHIYHFNILNQEIENRLTTSANLAIEFLGRDYHDKIIGKDTFTADEYDIVVDHFNKLCVELNLEYLWEPDVI